MITRFELHIDGKYIVESVPELAKDFEDITLRAGVFKAKHHAGISAAGLDYQLFALVKSKNPEIADEKMAAFNIAVNAINYNKKMLRNELQRTKRDKHKGGI